MRCQNGDIGGGMEVKSDKNDVEKSVSWNHHACGVLDIPPTHGELLDRDRSGRAWCGEHLSDCLCVRKGVYRGRKLAGDTGGEYR